MKINETFGECLKKLIKILNLKGSILAKGINVDSSLVYKWLRNERVPSYSSSYIDLISDYLVKSIINSFQQESITKVLEEYGFQISGKDLKNISDAIHICLLEAQGYSIEICVNKKIIEKRKVLSKTGNSSKILNRTHSIINNLSCQSNAEKKHVSELPKLNPSEDLPWDSDNVIIIKGNKEILYSVLALLHSATIKPHNNDDVILITLNNSINLLRDNNEINTLWKRVLYKLLNKKWKIIFLARLNNGIINIIRIIEDAQFALATGNYSIYYYKKNDDILAVDELIIVPDSGVLFSFSSKLKNQVNCAFLFESKLSIKLFSDHFCQYFSSAKPLLHPYPSQISMEFQHKLIEIEENLGDRYIFKAGISAIDMPMNLFEKYTRMSKKPKQEKALRLNYHRRRLEAFKTQIKYYKYKSIWFRESIEKLVNQNTYNFDQYSIFDNRIPDTKDIICYLKNIVNLLEKYDNYEIAVVSKNDYEDISEISWMVKENSGVLFETYAPGTPKKNNFDYHNSKTSYLISESEAITLFQDYFMMLWNKIEDRNKQKEEVINWFKNQIAILIKKAVEN